MSERDLAAQILAAIAGAAANPIRVAKCTSVRWASDGQGHLTWTAYVDQGSGEGQPVVLIDTASARLQQIDMDSGAGAAAAWASGRRVLLACPDSATPWLIGFEGGTTIVEGS